MIQIKPTLALMLFIAVISINGCSTTGVPTTSTPSKASEPATSPADNKPKGIELSGPQIHALITDKKLCNPLWRDRCSEYFENGDRYYSFDGEIQGLGEWSVKGNMVCERHQKGLVANIALK